MWILSFDGAETEVGAATLEFVPGTGHVVEVGGADLGEEDVGEGEVLGLPVGEG